MSRIKIKNFGPIKEGFKEILADDTVNEWMDIKKVTMFIGNQGSGKSTVAKLISTFMWMEKALFRGDIEIDELNTPEKSFSEFSKRCEYFKMNHYFSINTYIEYIGDAFTFTCKGTKEPVYMQTVRSGKLKKILHNFDHLAPTGIEFSVSKIENTTTNYFAPQIIYVPSERNMLSLSNEAFELNDLPGAMDTFAFEYLKSKQESKGVIKLPIGNYEIEYDSNVDKVLLRNQTDAEYSYFTFLDESASGFQSLVPLFLTTRRLALSVAKRSKDSLSPVQKLRQENEINALYKKSNLSNDEKVKEQRKIESKYKISCFINIVEELEQNLFPTSQKEIFYSLLEFNNMNKGNKLVMTTHSPYLINYLTLAVQGKYLINLMRSMEKVADELYLKLEKIVPKNSMIAANEVIVYQLADGEIKALPAPNGFPSSKNYLNLSIAEGNYFFDQMLEIEQELL